MDERQKQAIYEAALQVSKAGWRFRHGSSAPSQQSGESPTETESV
jgi:hypothetical protein